MSKTMYWILGGILAVLALAGGVYYLWPKVRAWKAQRIASSVKPVTKDATGRPLNPNGDANLISAARALQESSGKTVTIRDGSLVMDGKAVNLAGAVALAEADD